MSKVKSNLQSKMDFTQNSKEILNFFNRECFGPETAPLEIEWSVSYFKIPSLAVFLFWGSILFMGWPRSVGLSSELQVKLEKRGVQCLLTIAFMSWWDPHPADRPKQFVLHLRNWMTGRCLLCIYMMCALGTPFCLEQPSSNVMEYHPCFKFLSKFKIFKVTWNQKSLKMTDCSICKSWVNCILIMAVTGNHSRSSFGWGPTEDTVAGLIEWRVTAYISTCVEKSLGANH